MGSKIPLGWLVSGPMSNSEKMKNSFMSIDSQENQEITGIVRKWWETKSCGTIFQVNSRTLEDKKSLEKQKKTTIKPPKRFQSQMLSKGTKQKLDCNASSALGQLRSLERRLAEHERLKLKYSDSIKKI